MIKSKPITFARLLHFRNHFKLNDNTFYKATIGVNFNFIVTLWSCKHMHVNYMLILQTHIAEKMKFSIKDFFRKCDQIRGKLWPWPQLLKKSLMENFIFCAMPN